jgi:hypothetical protein
MRRRTNIFSLSSQALAVVSMKDIIFRDVEFCRLVEVDHRKQTSREENEVILLMFSVSYSLVCLIRIYFFYED